MNIFEKASRTSLRFHTSKGMITTEDLWDLPLQHGGHGVDSLDDIAKDVARKIRDSQQTSFVDNTPSNSSSAHNELRLDILKHVIAYRIQQAQDAENRVVKAERRRKILAALESKQNDALTKMSEADLKQELADL